MVVVGLDEGGLEVVVPEELLCVRFVFYIEGMRWKLTSGSTNLCSGKLALAE